MAANDSANDGGSDDLAGFGADFEDAFPETPETPQTDHVAQLERELANERDARWEDQFIFIVLATLLLNVVFFSVMDSLVMDSLGGPIRSVSI